MKRDFDLLRRILLEIESRDSGVGFPEPLRLSDVVDDELFGHLKLLCEAKFIDAVESNLNRGNLIYPQRLTWAGHDFLDTIRDETIWRKTMSSLAKISGSASIEIVKAIAVSAAKEILGIN